MPSHTQQPQGPKMLHVQYKASKRQGKVESASNVLYLTPGRLLYHSQEAKSAVSSLEDRVHALEKEMWEERRSKRE